jgi:hypothetical protein
VTRDSGSIVIGWLTKLAVTLAVLGLIAFDGIALVSAHFNAADHANTVAGVAADTYKGSRNVQQAYDAASAEAAKNDESVDTTTFRVQPTDGKVTLVLHRTATTLWMQRVGFLKKYLDITASGEGLPVS